MNEITLTAQITKIKRTDDIINANIRCNGFDVSRPLFQVDIMNNARLLSGWNAAQIAVGDYVDMTGGFHINHPVKAGYPACLKIHLESFEQAYGPMDTLPRYEFSGNVIQTMSCKDGRYAALVKVPANPRYRQWVPHTVLTVGHEQHVVGEGVTITGTLRLRDLRERLPILDAAISPYTLVSVAQREPAAPASLEALLAG